MIQLFYVILIFLYVPLTHAMNIDLKKIDQLIEKNKQTQALADTIKNLEDSGKWSWSTLLDKYDHTELALNLIDADKREYRDQHNETFFLASLGRQKSPKHNWFTSINDLFQTYKKAGFKVIEHEVFIYAVRHQRNDMIDDLAMRGWPIPDDFGDLSEKDYPMITVLKSLKKYLMLYQKSPESALHFLQKECNENSKNCFTSIFTFAALHNHTQTLEYLTTEKYSHKNILEMCITYDCEGASFYALTKLDLKKTKPSKPALAGTNGTSCSEILCSCATCNTLSFDDIEQDKDHSILCTLVTLTINCCGALLLPCTKIYEATCVEPEADSHIPACIDLPCREKARKKYYEEFEKHMEYLEIRKEANKKTASNFLISFNKYFTNKKSTHTSSLNGCEKYSLLKE